MDYPNVAAELSISCDRIRRGQNDIMKADLSKALAETWDGEVHVLAAIDWVKDHAPDYFAAPLPLARTPDCHLRMKKLQGFMREWCSFVSLYKDSYISGPNRFEVMTNLAKNRGLNITGMAIAGKPGGLVVEGEEGDVVEFMELMRTEFFETLNPRGRKLTTRLQERWPRDQETERFEAAEIAQRFKNDTYKAADREAGLIKKAGEKERLEKLEKEDRARLNAWTRSTGCSLSDADVDKLIKAGPPSKCTKSGVYFKCGCEEPPSREEIENNRIFKDFTVFTGKAGFEASYQEAGKIFKDMGQMNGFDAMFTYRFS
jgi:hypothetical protein